MGDIDVDFFLGTLENLIMTGSKINYIQDKKHQLESLAEDIKYLRGFLKLTEKKRKEHPEVMHLVVRIRDVISETENIVELVVVGVYKADHSDQDDLFLDLESVRKEIMTLRVEVERILDKDVYDNNGGAVKERKHSSTESEGGPPSSLEGRDTYKVGEERDVVGFKDEVTSLMGKLHDRGNGGNLEIISIIGPGGGGKTTLAREVYDHPLTLQKFEIRAWVDVSQDYTKTMKRDLLISILKSTFPKHHGDYKEINEDKLGEEVHNHEDYKEINEDKLGEEVHNHEDYEEINEDKLGEEVNKRLKSKKYLVVMDDVWGLEAWNDIQRSFPREHNESKVMLTSRQPFQPDSVGCMHHFINLLPDSCSWELLQKKVFKKGQCPPELVDIGMQIAKKCKGLPLAIVAIAGILATEDKTINVWEEVAKHLSSIIAKSQEGTMEILELSYNHLPLHLKACFLYIGAYHEDYEIPVKKLIWLWIAEGFIQQTDGGESLEAIAKDHMIDLVERNLVMVARRDWVGTIKACRIHDILRELCIKKGREGNFFVQNYKDDSFSSATNNHRRLFIGNQSFDNFCTSSCARNLRSFLCPTSIKRRPKYDERELSFFAESFKLLRVLHIMNSSTNIGELKKGDLVHLRYLALHLDKIVKNETVMSFCNRWNLNIREVGKDFLTSLALRLRKKENPETAFSQIFCNLWNLEILELDFFGGMFLPPDVLKMVRLRNLCSKDGYYKFHLDGYYKFHLYYEDEGKENMLESLEILQGICSCEYCLHFLKRAPNLRKLRVEEHAGELTCKLLLYDLEFLKCLEILHFRGKLLGRTRTSRFKTVELHLPPTITRLALSYIKVRWAQLQVLLQTLPRLEVLKLSWIATLGIYWDTRELEEGFSQLKYLKLSHLDIWAYWWASEDHFPRLEVLVIEHCQCLEDIPIEFANLYELREIKVQHSTKSVEQSARKIQEEQKNIKGEDACLNLDARFNGDVYSLPFYYDYDYSSDSSND